MERMTWKRDLDGYEDVGLRDGVTVGDAICRLSSYEDTGLEPEEVAEYQHLCDSYVEADLDAKFVQFCIDAMQNGLSMDRIRELAQAEKDGRLVVIPCKVGNTVYIIRDKKIIIAAVEAIHQWISGKWKVSAHTDKRYTHWVGYEVSLDDFGKTAFLSREEAEAALKKRGEADNETD